MIWLQGKHSHGHSCPLQAAPPLLSDPPLLCIPQGGSNMSSKEGITITCPRQTPRLMEPCNDPGGSPAAPGLCLSGKGWKAGGVSIPVRLLGGRRGPKDTFGCAWSLAAMNKNQRSKSNYSKVLSVPTGLMVGSERPWSMGEQHV